MSDDQKRWDGEFQVRVFDTLGANELRPFVQGMANRLGVGAQRYGEAAARIPKGQGWDRPKDMVDTAILRAQVALQEGNREGLIDGANFLLLAWKAMPHHEPSESSPGVVRDGVIGRARGAHAHLNGTAFSPGEMSEQMALITREFPVPKVRAAFSAWLLSIYVDHVEAHPDQGKWYRIGIQRLITKAQRLLDEVDPQPWPEWKEYDPWPEATALAQRLGKGYTGGPLHIDVI